MDPLPGDGCGQLGDAQVSSLACIYCRLGNRYTRVVHIGSLFQYRTNTLRDHYARGGIPGVESGDAVGTISDPAYGHFSAVRRYSWKAAYRSSGIFHILEHSVLCGSERYPVKGPFVELMKSSLKVDIFASANIIKNVKSAALNTSLSPRTQ